MSLLGFSILPGSIILWQGPWHSTPHIQIESNEKQKGLSPWCTMESLWNVSFPCLLQPLSFQLPWTSFWLLATFPAQQKISHLSDLDWVTYIYLNITAKKREDQSTQVTVVGELSLVAELLFGSCWGPVFFLPFIFFLVYFRIKQSNWKILRKRNAYLRTVEN